MKPAKVPNTGTKQVPGRSVERALGTAYQYLGKRERTAAEVARRLRRDGFDAETVEHSLAALREEGALDDLRFARLFTEDKRKLEQWGSERIRRVLIEREAEPEAVAAALDTGSADDADVSRTERDRALALLHRRFSEPPRTRRDRDRALGVLLRKGYEMDLALEALSSYARQ